jgi:uroporphyrin-III C-methyltransferase
MSVHLVGAGPGDPGLITARGLELLRACEVLLHDRLVAPALLDEAPADAIRIAHEPHTQAEINDLLVEYGRTGFLVVRLKGGDPFVFGRGGEEARALADAGVDFEVVPGVSALSAVPASVGIPVTHRGVASQVTVVAAHCSPEGTRPDYAALARTPGTLVFFMARRALRQIAAELIAHGLDPMTPSAAIASGTLPEQRSVRAPIAEIAAAAAELESAVLLVVGDVVSLADCLVAERPTAVREACTRWNRSRISSGRLSRPVFRAPSR